MVRQEFTQNVSKLFPFPIIYVNSISNSPKGNTKRENCSWNNNHWVTRNVPQKHCQKHIIQLGSKMYQKGLKMVFNSKNTLFAEHYANVNGKGTALKIAEHQWMKDGQGSPIIGLVKTKVPFLLQSRVFFSLIIALIWIQDLFVLLGGRWHFQRFKRWRRT